MIYLSRGGLELDDDLDKSMTWHFMSLELECRYSLELLFMFMSQGTRECWKERSWA